MPPSRQERFIGTLLCGCIGDILGSSNEGKTFNEIRKDGIVTKWLPNTGYTDDTEMTIILAKYFAQKIDESKMDVFDLQYNIFQKTMIEEIHELYKETIKTSTRGYSQKTRSILTNWSVCTPAGLSNTNGAIMRISPLALLYYNTNNDLCDYIKYSIYCTHGDSKDAIDAAFVHVKLLQSMLLETKKTAEELYVYALSLAAKRKNKYLHSLLLSISPDNKHKFVVNKWDITKTIFGFDLMQIEAIDCLICALTCFFYNFKKPYNALIMAANCGGDTDTIAKLVGDLVGAMYGISWIPNEWQSFEGKEELIQLSIALYSRFPPPKPVWSVAAPTSFILEKPINEKIPEIIDLID